MAREPEKRGFRYQRRSPDSVKERANMRGGGYDTIFKPQFKVWKPKEGKNLIRILPPTWDDAGHFGLDIFVNYGIGADNQSYLSLHRMKEEKDPLFEAMKEAEKDGDKDLAKKLRPSQRILYWLVDRNDEDEGPQLWAAPFGFDKDLANVCYDEDTKEVVYIDDPEKGCDLRFSREGSGLTTKYPGTSMKLLKPSPLCDDEGIQVEWLEFISKNSLPDVLNFYDYNHIALAFNGQVAVNDDATEKPRARQRPAADEGDEPPPRRRARETEDDEQPPPRRRAAPEPDDEEENGEPPAAPPRQSLRDRIRAGRGAAREEPPFDTD